MTKEEAIQAVFEEITNLSEAEFKEEMAKAHNGEIARLLRYGGWQPPKFKGHMCCDATKQLSLAMRCSVCDKVSDLKPYTEPEINPVECVCDCGSCDDDDE